MKRCWTTTTGPLLCLLALGTLAGCGRDEGPVRYDVSGTITFKNAPVPSGSIVFTPDTSQGNSGPQGTARIINGRYDTASGGRGTVGGPHMVHIIATAHERPEDAELIGPLAEYTFAFELPQQTTKKDIEIPPQ